jgi:hypothetical protein
MKKIISYLLGEMGFKIMDTDKFIASPRTSKFKIIGLIEKLHPYKLEDELIRLGPKGDGGYLVPNDLKNIKACFSPGVDQISGFEEDCFKLGMQLFLADKSVVQPNLNLSSHQYSFLNKYVGCTNDQNYITLNSWVESSNIDKDSDLLLQMDIEGGEYMTLLNMSDSLLKQFRIIVIEFHQLEKLWHHDFFNLAEETFNKILQNHVCVHIHPNNWCALDVQQGVEIPKIAEFTFVRKDRLKGKQFQTIFPNKLDYDNTRKESIPLPKIWYK